MVIKFLFSNANEHVPREELSDEQLEQHIERSNNSTYKKTLATIISTFSAAAASNDAFQYIAGTVAAVMFLKTGAEAIAGSFLLHEADKRAKARKSAPTTPET